MSSLSDLVSLLLSADMSADKVVRAIELAEQHAHNLVESVREFRGNSADNPQNSAEIVENSADRRRRKDRERKRELRDMSAENPQNSADMSQTVHKESFLIEDSEKKEGVVVARARRGTRLPPDWNPEGPESTFALQLLGNLAAVTAELAKFRDYWRSQPGQRGVKLDWNATWRNWIRNAGVPRANGPTLPFNGQPAAAGGFDSAAYLAKREKRIAEQMALREQVERERGAAP